MIKTKQNLMYQVPPQISKWSESYYFHNSCLRLPNIDSLSRIHLCHLHRKYFHRFVKWFLGIFSMQSRRCRPVNVRKIMYEEGTWNNFLHTSNVKNQSYHGTMEVHTQICNFPIISLYDYWNPSCHSLLQFNRFTVSFYNKSELRSQFDFQSIF